MYSDLQSSPCNPRKWAFENAPFEMEHNILTDASGIGLVCRACKSEALHTKGMVLRHIKSDKHIMKLNGAYADLTPTQKQKLKPIAEDPPN